jgi:HEXXH motif-containing protein
VTSEYAVPSADIGGLGRGYGAPGVLSVLSSAQLSKRILLLTEILRHARGAVERQPAIAILTAAQRAAPGRFAEFIREPSIGVWLARCIRMMGRPADRARMARELRYLDAIAVAAAARTGIEAELDLSTSDDQIFLPTLGTALLRRPSTPVRVRDRAVRFHDTLVVPVDSTADRPEWLALRRLDRADGGGPVVGDIDPYLDCFGLAVANRQSPATYARWNALYREATALLRRYAPARAAEQAEMRAVVPLAPRPDGNELSATSRQAYGACALTPPRSAAAFAVTLVHEHQHSKLGALLDLAPLYAPAVTPKYRVPWRPDLRPIGSLLQGTYAFLAVADAWYALRTDERLAAEADIQFAYTRRQVSTALRTLSTASELNDLGRLFIAGMRERLDELMDVPVRVSAPIPCADRHSRS